MKACHQGTHLLTMVHTMRCQRTQDQIIEMVSVTTGIDKMMVKLIILVEMMVDGIETVAGGIETVVGGIETVVEEAEEMDLVEAEEMDLVVAEEMDLVVAEEMAQAPSRTETGLLLMTNPNTLIKSMTDQ